MADKTVQAASTGAQNATPAAATAFRSQTQPTIKRPGVVLSSVLGASPVPLQDTQIPPTTLLRCIYLEVTCTAAGNAATVAFQPDAPLNVFSSVNFHDAQGTSIVGSFDSFTLAMAQKYFGFVNNSDVTNSAVYSVTPGSGASGGSFTEVFRIPVEIVSRTGVGSQINTDTQSPLVLSLTLNTLAAIYSTAPTAAPTVSVVVSYGGYWNQSGSPSNFPTPQSVGSLNYINWTNYVSLSGQQQFQLSNIGLGNSLMNLMFINRLVSTNARDDASFANPLQIAYRGNVLGQWSQLLWKHEMSEAYNFPNAVVDGPNGLNRGVYNRWFNGDFTNDPGNTLFYALLNTAVGDSVELTGNWTAAANLYEVVNFLAASGPVSAIQGR